MLWPGSKAIVVTMIVHLISACFTLYSFEIVTAFAGDTGDCFCGAKHFILT